MIDPNKTCPTTEVRCSNHKTSWFQWGSLLMTYKRLCTLHTVKPWCISRTFLLKFEVKNRGGGGGWLIYVAPSSNVYRLTHLVLQEFFKTALYLNNLTLNYYESPLLHKAVATTPAASPLYGYLSATCMLACSRRSDSRAREKNSRSKKENVFPVYNLTCSPLAAVLYHLNTWNRLHACMKFESTCKTNGLLFFAVCVLLFTGCSSQFHLGY